MKTIPIIPQKKVLRTVQLRGGFSDRNGIAPYQQKYSSKILTKERELLFTIVFRALWILLIFP